jgi:hypothetical protein
MAPAIVQARAPVAVPKERNSAGSLLSKEATVVAAQKASPAAVVSTGSMGKLAWRVSRRLPVTS